MDKKTVAISFKLLVILLLSLPFNNQSFSQCPKGYELSDSNLVFNGDFSYGNRGFTSEYKYARSWHFTQAIAEPWGVYNIMHNASYSNRGFGQCLSPEGHHNPMLCTDGHYKQVDVWRQKIKIKPKTNYLYKANFAVTCCWDGVFTTLGFYANDKRIGIMDSEPDTCAWTQFSEIWNSQSNKTVSLAIQNIETERYGNDFVIDDIQLYECIDINEKNRKKNKEVVKHSVSFNDKQNVLIDPSNQIRLQGVSFHSGKETIKEKSFAKLNVIADHLKKVKSLKAEFIVHHGVKNRIALALSQKRADKVKEYITQQGIDGSRIVATGLGYKQPLRKDKRKESIQLNERVLVRFFGKN